MRLPLIFTLIILMHCPAHAQNAYYPQVILPDLDSLLLQVHKDWQQKNKAGINQFLLKTDRLLQPVQKGYPLFTAIFMNQFYTYLFTGKTPAAALQATQLLMSKTYPASDWAAFILVE